MHQKNGNVTLRKPFLFVDKLVYSDQKRYVGEVTYGADSWFFKGHFPDYPVVPGVILVESMAQCGGAGNIAMQEVAHAPADGYTLIIGHIGSMAVNPFMFAKLPYDVNKDFTPISLLVKIPTIYVVYAALPALVFRVARSTALSWELLRVAAIAWIVGLVGFALAWWLSRVLKLPKRAAAAFILVTALGNTGYIGYPVTTMLLGAKSLPQAVFYDVFGTVGLLFTVGIMIAGRMGKHEGPVSIVRELLTAPALVALLAGLASRLLPVPVPVESAVMDWLNILASMTLPLVMISLGLTLSPAGFKGRLAVIGVSGAVKLLVLPLVAVAAAMAFGDAGGQRLVMLQAGMPSMMLTLVIAERFGLDADLAASTILATTVACVASIPLLQLLVR